MSTRIQEKDRPADAVGMQLTLREIEERLDVLVGQSLAVLGSGKPIPDTLKNDLDDLCQLTISLVIVLSRERGEDDSHFSKPRELLIQCGGLFAELAKRGDLPAAIRDVLPAYQRHITERIQAIDEMIESRSKWRMVVKEYSAHEARRVESSLSSATLPKLA